MTLPRIYADFQNADTQGRVRLNCAGTANDLADQHVALKSGLQIQLYSDDGDEKGDSDELSVCGTAEYSEEESCWVARIDWNALRHTSDLKPIVVPNSPADGAGVGVPHSTSIL